MRFGGGRRYYCTNLAGCEYARTDHVYGHATYLRNKRCCNGKNGDGCGAQLVDGGRPAFLLRWAAIVFLLAGLAFALRYFVFPAPYAGFSFAKQSTSVVEGQAMVGLSIVRKERIGERALVRFRTEDGNARSGRDFVGRDGVVEFQPGESAKSINVSLLPGGSESVGNRSFTVTLSNVEGLPQQVIVIEPYVPDADTVSKTDALVHTVSVLSVDIAGFYVKRQMLHRVVNLKKLDADTLSMYEEQLHTLDANMEQAQARYLQTLKDLSTINRGSVSSSFGNWAATLDQKDMQQQRKATLIAQKQFLEMLQTGRTQMEVWAQELSTAIPKSESGMPGFNPV